MNPLFLFRSAGAHIGGHGGPKGFLAFWMGGAGAVIARASATSAIDGKRRRRHRTADDELTEEEVKFMFRKIAELKRAKSEREKLKAAKELEVAISQAAQDEEAAKVIVKTIERKRGPAPDYAAVMRDAALLTSIVYQLDRIAKQAALEAREEDDIAVMLLLAL